MPICYTQMTPYRRILICQTPQTRETLVLQLSTANLTPLQVRSVLNSSIDA